MKITKSPPVESELASLNLLLSNEAEEELLKCCGSKNWVRRMIDERPFQSLADLMAGADRVWWSLETRDWLEAFRSHPKIGEQKAAAATGVQAQEWSEHEQSGTRSSAPKTMEALAELNHAYEEKFGYIFIVCASGKSSEEMLAILRSRMENNKDEELRNAAAEQAQITQLRLRKLIENSQS